MHFLPVKDSEKERLSSTVRVKFWHSLLGFPYLLFACYLKVYCFFLDFMNIISFY